MELVCATNETKFDYFHHVFFGGRSVMSAALASPCISICRDIGP